MSLTSLDTKQVIELNDTIFALDYNDSLVNQVCLAYRAKARQGSSAQKNRSHVSKTGAKPWAQKGTGRARAGDAKSPIWRGGGVTFASRTRDYSQKVNKKMYNKAIKVILSQLLREERILVVSDLSITEPKTKLLKAKLTEMGLIKTLLVTAQPDGDLFLAARNLPNVYICEESAIDPISLIGVDKVCISAAALEQLQERLA
jgi:large subunit ribosomal protein L4